MLQLLRFYEMGGSMDAPKKYASVLSNVIIAFSRMLHLCKPLARKKYRKGKKTMT